MKISLHPAADAEFAEAVGWYESKQHGLGLRFYEEALCALSEIAESPLHSRLRKHHRRINLRVFPYYIAYAIEADNVWVLAVAHAHRKPDYWNERII